MSDILIIAMAIGAGYSIDRLAAKMNSDLLRFLVAPFVTFTILLGFSLLEG